MARNRSGRVGSALVAAALPMALLACSLSGAQPTIETVLEPTIRPEATSPPAASLPPAPTSAPVATTAALPGQVVLHPPFAIILAYSGPQIGNGSALFQPLQQASQKGIEDYGLIHGLIQGSSVNLLSFDDGCSESGGASVAQQIVSDDRIVGVLGPVCSKAVTGALPILESAGVVMISASATNAGLSAGGPSVFNRDVLDDDQIAAAGLGSQAYIENLDAVQLFQGTFEQWGGQLPEQGLNHYVPYQYDAAGILMQALAQTASLQPDGSLVIDRAALRAAVRATSGYAGVTGTITLEADGNRAP